MKVCMEMSKNILLVYPKPTFDKKPRFGFSIQLLQLSSILKSSNMNVFYLDYSYSEYSDEIFSGYIKDKHITDIVVEIDTFALKRSENVLNALRILGIAKQLNIFTIAFGYGCILDGSEIENADLLIKGNALKEIPEHFGIINSYNDQNCYDELPFPDRKALLDNDFFKKNLTSTLIRTAEGCLNSCTFCQRQGWQSSFKSHSIDYVLAEFEYLHKNGYKNVWITDENFTFDLNRAKSILRLLAERNLTVGMKIAISSWCHIDIEFLDLARSANVSIISMGIESANKAILDFYNKKVDLEKTNELITYADSIGLYMVGNFIIGAPMETEETIMNTFRYIESSRLDQVNIKILDYMIGSKLYDTLGRKDEHHYFGCYENGLCDFTLQELKEKKEKFLDKFYKSRKDEQNKKFKKYKSRFANST